MFYLLNIIKSLEFQIISSTPSKSILCLSNKISTPSFIILTFPKQTFPLLSQIKDIILIKNTRKNIYVVFKKQGSFNINFVYHKLLCRVHEYSWDAERGLTIPGPIHIFGNKIIYGKDFVDLFMVPDFTVPFLAFNTCGASIAFFMSMIVKNYIRRKFIKY